MRSANMLKLQKGKTYIWLFPIWAIVFLGGFVLSKLFFGRPNGGFFTLPLFGMWLLAAQLKSGVALDSKWRANHARGSSWYQTLIIANIAWIALAGAIAGVAIIFM
jgi:hypothetical protein